MKTEYLTPESPEDRAEFRRLYADPDYPIWDWDQDTGRWELPLFEAAIDPGEDDREWCYVYIAPSKDGRMREEYTVFDPGHRGWVIGNICDDIYVPGTLQEAKAVLDNLIQPTPEIPVYVQLSIQPEAPVLTVEEFKALKPGDLIGQNDWCRGFLVEHVIADYPGPLGCRIYCRQQGGKNLGNLETLMLADHRELGFVRRVRKPLGELRALISSIEKGGLEPNYEVARSVGISRGQVNCLEDIVKTRPDLVAALLDGTISLNYVLGIARDANDKPIYHNNELVYCLVNRFSK
jgi:hypothetical protein